VVAAFGMASDLGAVSGPLVAGALAETSYPAAFAATAGVLSVGLAMSWRMPETVHVGGPPPGRAAAPG
jgi:hypothetical protein